MPVEAYGHESSRALGHEVVAGLGGKLEPENNGPGADFLNAGVDAEQVAVAAGTAEPGPGLGDGEAKALGGVPEGFLGRQARGPQELLDGPVHVTEVADEVHDAVRVGVAETHSYGGAVYQRWLLCFGNGKGPPAI